MRSHIQGMRRAFTLMSCLVVIAIIAILIGLLLPAVQKVREAANRTKCQNNLKQLGLACMNYEAAYHGFPPALTGYYNPSAPPTNWAVYILPYIEQGVLYQQYDFSKGYYPPGSSPGFNPAPGSAINSTIVSTEIKMFECPSAPARQPYTVTWSFPGYPPVGPYTCANGDYTNVLPWTRVRSPTSAWELAIRVITAARFHLPPT